MRIPYMICAISTRIKNWTEAKKTIIQSNPSVEDYQAFDHSTRRDDDRTNE